MRGWRYGAFMLAGAVAAPTLAQEAAPPQNDDIVDEDIVARALERALVREGGLLLPQWSLEVEPRISHTFRGSDSLQIVEIEGEPTLARQRQQRDVLRTSIGLRAGLPWSSQASMSVPYVFERQETITGTVAEQTQRTSGLGDIDLAITRQLLYERNSGVDLLGGLYWSGSTGRREVDDGIALDSGFPVIQAGVTAVTRRDPLVFFATVSYATYFEETQAGRDVEPGDSAGLRVGAILAASPDASLRLAFDLVRSRDTDIAGQRLRGSGRTAGVLDIGVSAVLGARTLLGAEVGVGITDDAPDYRLSASLSYRLR